MNERQELLVLQQEVRAMSEAKTILGGLVDAAIEDNDALQAELRQKDDTIRALTASVVRLYAESERHAAERDDLLKVIQRHGMRVEA